MPYTERLHAQASAIADQLQDAALNVDLDNQPALQLAQGPIATLIAEGATCCVDDQLGLAVMVAAELALRATRA
jgi:hypothetical protein